MLRFFFSRRMTPWSSTAQDTGLSFCITSEVMRIFKIGSRQQVIPLRRMLISLILDFFEIKGNNPRNQLDDKDIFLSFANRAVNKNHRKENGPQSTLFVLWTLKEILRLGLSQKKELNIGKINSDYGNKVL